MIDHKYLGPKAKGDIIDKQDELIAFYREGMKIRDEMIHDLKRLVNIQKIELEELKKETHE